MPDLQDCALDALRCGLRRADTYLKPAQTIYVLQNTLPTSVLHKFAVEMAAFAVCLMRVKVDTFRPCFEESADFACELMSAVLTAFPPFHVVRDPRGRSPNGNEWVCRWGGHGIYVDPGSSTRANASQAGSEDFGPLDIPSPPGW